MRGAGLEYLLVELQAHWLDAKLMEAESLTLE
ncbi:hypothetical protein sync_1239 [Synechococcus sp. CC9311]|nr:hypothetical protein sync_1239 [Synechococcus sp. CC9311]